MTLKVKGLDHIVLRTDRLDSMLAFYCDVLGCSVERTLEPEIGLYQLRAGDSLIDIVPLNSELGRAGGGKPQGPQRVDHFCLRVECESESALIAFLRANGVNGTLEFAERYGATGFGRSLYLQDPDGNRVELKRLED